MPGLGKGEGWPGLLGSSAVWPIYLSLHMQQHLMTESVILICR